MPGLEEIYTDKTIHMTNIPIELSCLRPDIVSWWNSGRKFSLCSLYFFLLFLFSIDFSLSTLILYYTSS